MSKHLLLFVDIETTGHDPLKLVNGVLRPWHEIIDLAGLIVNPQESAVVAEFESKIIPEHPERCLGYPPLVNNYPERARMGEWKHAVSLKDALNGHFNFVSSWAPLVLCGQNFFFDWSFLFVAFAMCGCEEKEWGRFLHYSKMDTRSMAIQELREPDTSFNPNNWSMRNGELLKKLGIEPEPEVHTAINGARKTFEVFCRLEELKRGRFQ